jgi:hypothetical protein
MVVAYGLLLTAGLAGCGGGGTTGVPTANGSASAGAGGAVDEREQALKFGQCMRDNGVPNFADPAFSGNGGMSIDAPEGSDPVKIDAAMKLCKQFLPNGGEPQKIDPQRLELLRQLAQCMRDHGVKDFPDPTDQGLAPDGNNPAFSPNNPTFAAAQQACQGIVPNDGETATTQTGGTG